MTREGSQKRKWGQEGVFVLFCFSFKREMCLCVCGRDPAENRESVLQEGAGRFSGATSSQQRRGNQINAHTQGRAPPGNLPTSQLLGEDAGRWVVSQTSMGCSLSLGGREWVHQLREVGEAGAGGQGRMCGPHSSEAVRGPRRLEATPKPVTVSCPEATRGWGRASSSSHLQRPGAGVSIWLTCSPREHNEMQGARAPGCRPRCGWDPGEEGALALHLKLGSPATPAPTRRAGSAWTPGSTARLPLCIPSYSEASY